VRLAPPHLRCSRPRLRRLAFVALAGLLAGCGGSTLPAIHSEPERLVLGRRALLNHEYNVAIELLKGYVENNAGGADVDQAVELLGESYLGAKEWGEAQTQFERLLRDYPESDSAGTAAFRLGDAIWKQARGPDFDQENTLKALEQWQGYLRSYPGHWLNTEGEKRVQLARTRLADKLADTGLLYIKLGRTRPARIYMRRVLDDYPDTPPAAQAALGLALADALEGKRAEAMAELRQVQSSYPNRPEAQRAAKELVRLERHDPQRKK
jgi:outer membrane protein assembly factor BamD